MRSRKLDGGRLRSLREDAWMTQGELASEAEVSRQTIADMENGRRPYPKGATMLRIARVLQVEREDLLEASLEAHGGASSPPEEYRSAARGLGHHAKVDSTLFGTG